MLTNLYVIFDAKAQMYNKPFTMINDQVALRAAHDLVNDKSTECAKNPHDFAMFHIGNYDDTTAEIKPLDSFNCICRFHELQIDLEFSDTQLHEINEAQQ